MDDLERKVFGPLPDETWIYPGHGKDTTLGVERPHLHGVAPARLVAPPTARPAGRTAQPTPTPRDIARSSLRSSPISSRSRAASSKCSSFAASCISSDSC